MKRRLKTALFWLTGIMICLTLIGGIYAPEIAASLLVHPIRRHLHTAPPEGCEEVVLSGSGIQLRGWQGKAVGPRRGQMIFLHGVMDNRASGAGILMHFRNQGFDVLAYDGRAHGDSGGQACTYGHLEKEDLRLVIQQCPPGAVLLVGASLGGAVALQTAAIEPRVAAMIAAEAFSDLQTVAQERAPFFLTHEAKSRALALAGTWADFRVEDVSPVEAAKRIQIPVFLIHGEQDTETSPDHSRRIFAALAGPKRLSLVRGAKHNQSLTVIDWKEIDDWVASVCPILSSTHQ